MSAKIYKDGAFQDAPIPKVFAGGVEKETTGRIWKDGSWQDVWSPRLWLYRDGDECVDVTGGWMKILYWSVGADFSSCFVKNPTNMIVREISKTAYGAPAFYTKNAIPCTGNKKLYVEYSISNVAYNPAGGVLYGTGGDTRNYYQDGAITPDKEPWQVETYSYNGATSQGMTINRGIVSIDWTNSNKAPMHATAWVRCGYDSIDTVAMTIHKAYIE